MIACGRLSLPKRSAATFRIVPAEPRRPASISTHEAGVPHRYRLTNRKPQPGQIRSRLVHRDRNCHGVHPKKRGSVRTRGAASDRENGSDDHSVPKHAARSSLLRARLDAASSLEQPIQTSTAPPASSGCLRIEPSGRPWRSGQNPGQGLSSRRGARVYSMGSRASYRVQVAG